MLHHRRAIASVTGLVLALGGASVAAENLADPLARVSAAAWYVMPTIEIDQGGGPTVDGGDLGLEDSSFSGMVDAYVDLPVPLVPGIHAGAWRWREEPDSGDTVTATGGYAVALWELELIDRVGVAVGGGVYAQDLDRGDGGERTVLATGGLRSWLKLTDGITAEARLLAGGWSGDRATDLAAQITWRVAGPLAVVGGWRHVVTEQELGDDTWKATLSGPFLGAAAVF